MRVLIVIALLVAAVFLFLFVLADLARDLSRHSFQTPPDLDGSDDWDVEVNEFADDSPPEAHYSERRADSRYAIGGMHGDDFPSNAPPIG